MPCLNPDGSLTRIARAVLTALESEMMTAPQVAGISGLPLWRVRSSLRELHGQDLVKAAMSLSDAGDAPHQITPSGREVLDLSRALDGEELPE